MHDDSVGAIILAAGLGSRLGELGNRTPKGLISVGGEALVNRSVRLLHEMGVSHVTIVTGHLQASYSKVFGKSDSVDLVPNNLFATSGSLESLRVGLLHSNPSGPVLVLDSDIIFEPFCLDSLLGISGSGVLASGKTQSGDEVWIVSEEWRAKEISKNPHKRGAELSEFVGITRLEGPLQKKILELCSSSLSSQVMEYEQALNLLCEDSPITVCFEKDLAWSEIDTLQQLERASQMFGHVE